MATGTIWQPGGVSAPADVRDAGLGEWAATAGVRATSPLVGGYGMGRADMPNNVDGSRSRVITTGSLAASSGSTPDGPGVHLLDDWRDALNPQSPAFWLLLLLLVMVGFMQLRVVARAGKAHGTVALG